MCGALVTREIHECNKLFCANSKHNRDVGNLCYMRPLMDVLPIAGDKVIYVFYDFETTQNTRYADKAKLNVPDLVYVQQFCGLSEGAVDWGDRLRCGRRKHSFCYVPVVDTLSYLCKPRFWANKVVAIAHNAKLFYRHFILNRVILLKRKP